MNLKKQAAKDAAEYARAQMFYGQGAGTRRKLINETVQYKQRVVPGYSEAFVAAMGKQDMAKHAAKAGSERMRKDVSKKVGRNTRGLLTGNRQSFTTGVGVILVVGTWAHTEGYDKEALEYGRKKVRQLKNKLEVRDVRAKVHNITKVK